MKGIFKGKRAAGLVLLAALFLFPGLTFASGGEGEHSVIGGLILKWVNFIIFAGFLYLLIATTHFRRLGNLLADYPVVGRFFSVKPLGKSMFRKAWDSRREKLEETIRRSREDLARASEELRVAETKMHGLQSESDRMRREIRGAGERECADILDEATKKSARTVEQVKRTLAMEERTKELEIEREYGEKVVSRAAEILSGELTIEKDNALRAAALSGVKGLVQ